MKRVALLVTAACALTAPLAAATTPTAPTLRECPRADGYLVVENMTCKRGSRIGRKFWRLGHVKGPPLRVRGFYCTAAELTIYCRRGNKRIMWAREP